MRGHYVHRKAGWDCHGLPVEIAVEKELGVTQKSEITERIGIERFVERCRESVVRHVDEWELLTDRIAFWVDFDEAYWTMDPDYIESVWWMLKQLWDKHLLEEDFKVVPYCPRCGTSLSSHEQHYTGSYQTVTDPSVFVRFPLVDEPDYRVCWCGRPRPGLCSRTWRQQSVTTSTYVACPRSGRKTASTSSWRASASSRFSVRTSRSSRHSAEAISSGVGTRLRSTSWSSGETGHTVRPGDFVSTEEGTGIVHLAPYGEDDMMVARRDGLPVDADDRFHRSRRRATAGHFAEMWFKDADEHIVEDMRARGVLFRSELYEHSYPHCWRCGTPLIYYARRDWYIRTSQLPRATLRKQRGRQLAAADHQIWTLRGLARQQRRLEPEPRSFLGYAASDMALRGWARRCASARAPSCRN